MPNSLELFRLDKMIIGDIFQVNHSDILQIWRTMDEIVDGKISVERGLKGNYVVNEIFDAFRSCQKESGVDIYAEYTGDDSFGGFTRLIGIDEKESNSPKDIIKEPTSSSILGDDELISSSILEDIKFEMTAIGLIEAFYVAMVLPNKGASWHGLAFIDDCSFILTKNLFYTESYFKNEKLKNAEGNSLAELKSQSKKKDIWKHHGMNCLDKLNIPPGIRIKREDMGYLVSCLTVYVDYRIVDRNIKVIDGKVIQNGKQFILDSDTIVMY
jgi:hypothetical protein